MLYSKKHKNTKNTCFTDLEHEGMIAKFPELHNSIHQRLGSSLPVLLTTVLRQHNPLLLHVLVQGPLQTRHLTLDDVLNLDKIIFKCSCF